MRRLGDLIHTKKNCEQGEGFVKFCPVKKACVGDGGELKCALDDAFGIYVTVRSCCGGRFLKKLCRGCKNSLTVAKVFENKFGQVVENLPTLKGLGTSLALQCYAGQTEFY